MIIHMCIHVYIYFNGYLFLRERDGISGGGAERRGQRIQSRLCADSGEPDVGLELTNVRS